MNCAESLLTDRRELALNGSEWPLLVTERSSNLIWLSQNRYIHLSKEFKEIIVFQVIILFVLMFQNDSLVRFT